MSLDEEAEKRIPDRTFWEYDAIVGIIEKYFESRLWLRLKTKDHVYLEGEVALKDLFYHSYDGEVFNNLSPDMPIGSFEGDLVLQFREGQVLKIPGYNLVLHTMKGLDGFIIQSANLDGVYAEFETIEDE